VKYNFGWKNILAFIAILIIAATIIYVNNLARQMETEEKNKVEEWVEAYKELQKAAPDQNINLISQIITSNTTIPMIEVDSAGKIIDSRNLNPAKMRRDPGYINRELELFKSQHQPIQEQYDPTNPLAVNYFYYGDSLLLKQVRYYPYIQLVIVALFIIVTLIALTSSNKSTQNQVWVGLAKETAHQLGTPLSSIEAWLEMLREKNENETLVAELQKDIDRLKLITDRFSKIGSIPVLEEKDLVNQVNNMISYIRKRAPQKVIFSVTANDEEEVPAMISPPLFDWVLENLLKNALDALEGKGHITVDIRSHPTTTTIDVTDDGKGIAKNNFKNIFKPGFSTKKRGWGLGLSLAKRIIESYHKGKLLLRSSELNKGTTFRIVLRK
jgi:Histidine kinase-, DNA gyrase B-, and HSP90-like ATPase/His Kinase A (phospho-acceptor) domain